MAIFTQNPNIPAVLIVGDYKFDVVIESVACEHERYDYDKDLY